MQVTESADAMPRPQSEAATEPAEPAAAGDVGQSQTSTPLPEIGGRKGGLDPTRYGDWEKNGRCIDF
ncbi:MAG: DUF1674 domain-containing protein [Gammaproteobacteria bacterium]|nr:DUF1674 domain-containing protein [Gammaproteobacteria bacterium]